MEVLLVLAGALATAVPAYFVERSLSGQRREALARDELKKTLIEFMGIVSSIEWLSLNLYQRIVFEDSKNPDIAVLGKAADARVFPEVSKAFLDPALYPKKGSIRDCVQRIDELRDRLTFAYQALKLIGSPAIVAEAASVIRALNVLVDTAAESADDTGHDDVERQRASMKAAKATLRSLTEPEIGTIPLQPDE